MVSDSYQPRGVTLPILISAQNPIISFFCSFYTIFDGNFLHISLIHFFVANGVAPSKIPHSFLLISLSSIFCHIFLVFLFSNKPMFQSIPGHVLSRSSLSLQTDPSESFPSIAGNRLPYQASCGCRNNSTPRYS